MPAADRRRTVDRTPADALAEMADTLRALRILARAARRRAAARPALR
jgi:hypothetical protein